MERACNESEIVEIGGSDQVSYRDLMIEYARQRGLKRLMIPVPVLTPWLSSHWLGLVTPMYAAVGRKLIVSIQNPTVVENPSGSEKYNIRPSSAAEAIRAARMNPVAQAGKPKRLSPLRLIRTNTATHSPAETKRIKACTR
jgi:hypothetical protein